MPETVSIAELCWNARHACLLTGLQPVQWRWSIAAWMQHKAEQQHMMMVAVHENLLVGCHESPDLPPGCLGVYDGLPIYRTHPFVFNQPAVACVGARLKPPGF